MKIIFTLVKQPFHLSSFRYQLKSVREKNEHFLQFFKKIFDKKFGEVTFCGGNVLCQETLSGETFLTGNILSFVAGNIYFWQEVFVSRNLFVEHFMVNIL